MLTKSKTLMTAVVCTTLIVAPVYGQSYNSAIKAQLAQKTQAIARSLAISHTLNLRPDSRTTGTAHHTQELI
jgi:hypothetical protein